MSGTSLRDSDVRSLSEADHCFRASADRRSDVGLLRFALIAPRRNGSEGFNWSVGIRHCKCGASRAVPHDRSFPWLPGSVPAEGPQTAGPPGRSGVHRAGTARPVATVGCRLDQRRRRTPRSNRFAASARQLREGRQRPGLVPQSSRSSDRLGDDQRLADARGLRASGDERRQRVRTPRRPHRTVGHHTYGLGFHNLRGARHTLRVDEELARYITLVGP